MKEVELSYGASILIPNREFKLLKQMSDSKETKFRIDSLTPRAQVLASKLIDYQILNRDDEYFYLRPFYVKDESKDK